jgi:cyclic pyranopterin phosphate synthase
MPEEGVKLKAHKEILRYEQIIQILKEATKIGINKVRLTGGEPLIKKDIEILIEKISGIKEIKEFCLTTNGTLLAPKAKWLKQAGLTSINIEKYREITRVGNLADALKGIYAAIDEGFKIKLNMVVLKGKNEDEIDTIREFCRDKNIELQLINHFDLAHRKSDEYLYDRPPKCANCNRIRLLADGVLKPCLHSEAEYKVNFDNIRESLEKAILAKPEIGASGSSRKMFEIGG